MTPAEKHALSAAEGKASAQERFNKTVARLRRRFKRAMLEPGLSPAREIELREQYAQAQHRAMERFHKVCIWADQELGGENA